jgi:hypothetical protein
MAGIIEAAMPCNGRDGGSATGRLTEGLAGLGRMGGTARVLCAGAAA